MVKKHMRSIQKLSSCVLLVVTVAFLGSCDKGDGDHEALVRSQQVATIARVKNLAGQGVDVPTFSESDTAVFVFSRIDCPISNRYAVELNRIVREFSTKGIEFTLVYVDPDESAEAIRKHLAEYSHLARAYRDPEHNLVKLVGATVTPEVAVFCRNRGMVYRGRIDDQYVDFGKQRAQPNQRDLRETLTQILAKKIPKFRSTKAIGCYIDTGK